MRLTRAGEYAIRAVLFMAMRPFGSVTQRKEISAEMDIPMEFLGKIATQLKRAGIIEILQGPKGGFRLLVRPEELSLLRVVEAIMGEIFLNDCVIKPNSCKRSKDCAVHKVWEEARLQLRETLGQVTFDKLLFQGVC
jgi:Rrf2 family protein